METKPVMPRSGGDITAEWMRQALTAGGVFSTPAVSCAVVEDICAGVGMLGEILRCHLTYDDDTVAAPETVIVKLPRSDPKSLRIGKIMSLYKREYNYYRYLSPYAPIRSANLLYGDFENGSQRFVLVLEDLRGMETMDQVGGADSERTRRAVRAIAKLHEYY